MKICSKCKSKHKKNGIFCSRKCANSRKWSNEDKLKKSISAKKSEKVLFANRISRNYFTKLMLKICPICKIEFKLKSEYYRNKQICCSKKCRNKWVIITGHMKGKCGGYRKNSGRGKQGWYKGYFCQSSWELAWVIYQLDNNIKFERNTIGFEYEFNEKKFKFYPDFLLESGEYVEIKGWSNDQTISKLSQFPYRIIILLKKEMIPIINYVENKYGKDFIRLYEGNLHNNKKYKCLVCNNECKKYFCSRSCAGKGRHLENKITVSLF